MKVIIEYQCEICHKKYSYEQEAIDCEAKGEPVLNAYPIGLMYSYYHHGYVGIFSIAEVTKSMNSHAVSLSSWAVRTNGYPRYTLDKDLCGGSNDYCYTDEQSINNWIKYHNIPDKDVNNDEFKEMVKYLKSKNITPKYYDSKYNLITVK